MIAVHAVEIIRKKRDGGTLTAEEIQFMIEGATSGTIPDYQIAAFCMAIYFQGMTSSETTALTLAMAESGDTLDLSAIPGIKVDKHSTGGVADTTTLVVAPLVASLGVPVAKMSGRGLGHTGGTIDKLESIPGFRVGLSSDEFIRQVNTLGISIIGQTAQLAPADGVIYALRDVTATVESIPLIASSIMSKKLAAGADAFVLDVKAGQGAFMKTLDDAVELAKTMVAIGAESGRTTTALVTDMNQPLGSAIGNALEVREAIMTLQGQGPERLTALCIALAAEMVLLAGAARTQSEAQELVEKQLQTGAGLQMMEKLIDAQGGDSRVVRDPELLPQAKFTAAVKSPEDGYVHAVDPLQVGITAMRLGAGRETKDSLINLAVGVVLKHQIGSQVRRGDTLAVIHADSEGHIAEAERSILAAFEIRAEKPEVPPLIYKRITSDDV